MCVIITTGCPCGYAARSESHKCNSPTCPFMYGVPITRVFFVEETCSICIEAKKEAELERQRQLARTAFYDSALLNSAPAPVAPDGFFAPTFWEALRPEEPMFEDLGDLFGTLAPFPTRDSERAPPRVVAVNPIRGSLPPATGGPLALAPLAEALPSRVIPPALALGALTLEDPKPNVFTLPVLGGPPKKPSGGPGPSN